MEDAARRVFEVTPWVAALVILAAIILPQAIRILREYERGVIFRLGKLLRAKIVNAEGEFQAAEKMVQAAAMISQQPIALQLRFLQTMREISSEHTTTTFLPVPIDLFAPFLKGPGPAKS